MSGSISQITIRLMPGCSTNDPAVTPAPKPTTSTDCGSRSSSAEMWPSMRCSRMSCGSLDASTLPATWKLRTPFDISDTAIDEFMPSPTYRYFGSVVYVGQESPVRDEPVRDPRHRTREQHRDDECRDDARATHTASVVCRARLARASSLGSAAARAPQRRETRLPPTRWRWRSAAARRCCVPKHRNAR